MSLYGFYDEDNTNDTITFQLSIEINQTNIQENEFLRQKQLAKQYNVNINITKESIVTITTPSKLPLDFLLSLDKKENENMFELLSKMKGISDVEVTERLELCEAVVGAAHKSIGENVLEAARRIVAVVTVSNGTITNDVNINMDSTINTTVTNNAASNVSKSNNDGIVENEILAAQIILTAVDKLIKGFIVDSVITNNANSSNSNINSDINSNSDLKLSLIIAADDRLAYLLSVATSNNSSNSTTIKPPETLNSEITPTTASQMPSDISDSWDGICATVAARELEGLLKLKSFIKVFIIALQSSL